MDYVTKKMSRNDARSFAVILRQLFGLPEYGSFPVMQALEKVPDIFKGCYVTVIEDSEMPDNIPARCLPIAENIFVIEIAESTYVKAMNGVGACLNHICHEICHVFLFFLGYTPIFERSFGNREIPPYCSVEWQAKAVCGEVMMPYEETKNLSVDEIVKKYHVSYAAARYRKNY